MKEIVFFSNNKNKILEISNLFNESPLIILNLNDFKKVISPQEIGLTFEENAKIKSIYGLEKFKKICFADDSGICIKALDNGPGVKSKEFLTSKNTKKKVLNSIIQETKNKKNYDAFFQTTICLSLQNKKSLFFTGKIYGEISKKIKGISGFGYDPIFIPHGFNKTFAEMNMNEKNKISHRAVAIGKLTNYLNKLV